MKNCENCSHMRAKIQIVDGERKKQKFDYRGALARCVKGHFNNQTFRMYNNRGFPKVWTQANLCPDYTEAGLTKEIADLIVQAHEMLV